MMTAICPEEVLETRPEAQIETPAAGEVCLSDAEIMRRVRGIRASWSLAERMARREEADRRFETLLESIFAEAA
ncbi:MAG: hypothetical protein AAF802_05805 [Planctomycetota bacterium]